jgi:hypothetical protein
MDSPDREIQHIVDYMASQVSDEAVEHLEKVASESVYGRRHDVWDVHTDKDRWWVITNPTNLYTQKQFPSMDIAISFHIGLMARVLARSAYTIPDEENQKFAHAWRCWRQAGEAFEEADEAEEFQAVGMRCRESLIAFVKEASSQVAISEGTSAPKASDYVGWSNLIADTIASGASADRRRGYLKSAAKSTWELVNWLTHTSNAIRFDAQFALDATGHTLSVFAMSFIRFERVVPERCPHCGSYNLSVDYYHNDSDETLIVALCTVCGWEDVPNIVAEVPEHEQPAIVSEKSPEDLGACITVEVPLRGPKPPKPSKTKL